VLAAVYASDMSRGWVGFVGSVGRMGEARDGGSDPKVNGANDIGSARRQGARFWAVQLSSIRISTILLPQIRTGGV
jgi:hypothetical protein